MAKTFSFEEALKPASQAGAQQEPRTFSFEEAMKPAAPQQQQPTTFSFEEAMKAPEQPTFIDARGQKPPEPRPEDQSFLRSVADVPLNITQGGVSGIRMIADAFGADSGTSKTLRGVEDYLGDLMSAQAKQDKQEISRIMKEAEDKGVGDQVLAGLKALTVAPVDTVANALGTSAPAIIGGLGALVFGAPVAVATTAAVGIGGAMGAGTIKSAIYDATKEELTKLKLPPDEVERRAEAAQAYGGNNLDQIAIGTALGGLSAFGFETATLKNVASNIVGKVAAREAAEGAVAKGVGRRVGEHVVKEAVPEGIQGSQEQLAQNLALQREGIDTPTMRGVISQGVLEAGASAPLGAYAGLREKQPTADTTGAGDALRRLDELVQREEETGTKEEIKTKEEMIVPPVQQTAMNEPIDIYDSPQGAQAFVNILKANRPKENFAFRETEDGRFAIYQIPVEETGGTNVTPPITDTSGVGTEDTGKPPEDTGTGVPPSSEGTGLGVSDTDVTGAGVPKGVQSGALMSLEDAQNELYDTEDRLSKDPNATVEDFDAAQAKYDAIENEHISIAQSLGYANAQSASDVVDGPDYNGNLEAALESYEINLEDTLTEEGITNPLLVRRAREAFEKQADKIRGEREGAGSVKEKRNLLSYIGDLPQDKKRYDTYIQHPVHRHALDRVNEAIQQLTNFINKSGFEVNKVNSSTAKNNPEVQTAHRLASQISGSAARLLSKLDAVDRGLQRANPEQVEQAKQQLGSDTLAAREFLEQQASTEENKPSANVGFVGSSYAYRDSIAALVDTLPLNQFGVNKLQRMLNDNKLSFAEYTQAMTELQERMRDERDMKSATTSGLPKKRGFGRLMEALEDAAKQGKISPEAYKMVRWFVSKNPEMARDLAISIAQPKGAAKRNEVENGVLGEYNPAQRLVEIFLRFNPRDGFANYNNSDVNTAIHEILHHLERLMPKELQAALRNEWAVRVGEANKKADQALKRVNAQIKKQQGILKNPARVKEHEKARAELARLDKEGTKQRNILTYLAYVNEYNKTNNVDAADLAQRMITKGDVPHTMYALFDPSEFWAVTGSDIIAGRYGVSTQNKFKKIAQFLKEFIEYVKEAFGMPNDAPLLRGLKAILEGNGQYLSREQLRTGTRAALPNIKANDFRHGTSKAAAESIIRNGKLLPNAGERMYSYSQFGRKAVYLTLSNGWWLDRERALNGRAIPYDTSVPFKLDPKANIAEVNSLQDLDSIAQSIGEADGASMMNKFNVDNLDLEHHARKAKTQTFDEFVQDMIKYEREQLIKYEEPGAESITDLDSLAAVKNARWEGDEDAQKAWHATPEQIYNSYRKQYDDYKKYDDQYHTADEITKKLLDAGIDGIYISPDAARIEQEEMDEYDRIYDEVEASMPGADPRDVYQAASDKYREINPTYFDRREFPAATDQLALFRPELAIVDRARLAAGKPVYSEDWTKADTGVSDEELKAVETAMAAGSMHPTVVDAIANNDLAGALKAISQKVSGFYGELATRLAELNLPTGTRIGDQRNMTRRAIDLRSAEAQKTLFDFVRTMMPDTYAKYFENYDRAENLERVYKGLNVIVGQTAVKPVSPQLDTVMKAFDDAMKGLTAHGGYYPSFDLINLNPTTNQGLSYRVFLHETVHAATVMLLNTPADQRTAEQNEAIAELEKLFEAAKANTNIGFYGFRNLKEFIAEIYTNKEFQAELRKIPYPPARTNMFSRFVKLVMDMFGMDNITGRAMIEANKLFNADRSGEPVSAGPSFAGAKGPKKPRVRGPISATWRVVEDTIQSVKDWENTKKDIIPAMWDAGNGIFRNIMLGIMNLRQIADVTKTKFPQIASSIRIIEKMLAYRGKIMNEGGEIIQRWTKAQAKNLKGSQLLSRVMLEATIRGVEVDDLSTSYDISKVNKELSAAWNALGPEFRQVYRDVRDFYKRAIDETIRLMKERANNEPDLEKRKKLLADIDAQFGPDKLKGPYFPLRRFGEFWFQVGQGNFKEFYTYESRLDRNRAMAARKRELSKGNAQQRALAESIHSGNGVSELYSQNVANTQILKDVQGIIDSLGDTVVDTTTGVARDKTKDEVKDELKDSLNQLIYILLPQQSMRKMFINRKAIQGASGDMLRVFATHAVHSAYQRSRFKYAQEFMDNLSNAHDWVRHFAKGKDYEVYRDYINEVEKRSKVILGTEDTSLAAKVAGKASEATFFFMLSSPFTAILNTIGFAQVAMPYIGGKFGYVNANKRILENMGKYLKTAPTRTFSPLTKGHMAQVSFPSIVEGGQLEGILKDAAKQLLDEEQINISLTNDVFDIGSRPSATYTGTVNAVKRAVSGLFHQSERLNREITLLSVVELAYEKLMSEPIKDAKGIVQRDAQGQPMHYTDNATSSDGKTQYSQEALQLAINEAKDIAGLALGDFTRQMKPRFFTPPLMSVLTKFKQYSVMASYAIIRNAQLGLIKPFSKKELDTLRQELEEHYKTSPDKDKIVHQQMLEAQARQKEVAKEARRRLAGILGMTYLFGGYAAMPFFSLLTPILVGMLAGADDDDDEFFNWENWFKNYIETEFGGYAGAMLQKFGVEEAAANKAGRKISEGLMYGPGSVVTGGALSDRVSLDLKNLWYRDGRYSPDTRESIVESVIANAGPVVGLTVNAADAWDMAQNGQIGRAFEKMAPALFAKPITAARLATEGGKTKGGDTLVDEFTTAELAIQAVGLQPLNLAQAQKASIETVQKAQKITNQHDSIMNRLWMERENAEAFNDALEDAIEFSIRHPGYAITSKKIRESFEKRAKESGLASIYGARIPKPLRGELMGMPEYGRE